MSDLENDLKAEFQDEEYRYAYAESFLNTKIAAQVKTLREQREETQAEVAARMGIKQPGYRRFEDSNHSVWKTDSLWDIAKAYGVRLNISFETFGSLLEEKRHFSKETLKRAAFKDDPAFKELAASDEGIDDKKEAAAKFHHWLDPVDSAFAAMLADLQEKRYQEFLLFLKLEPLGLQNPFGSSPRDDAYSPPAPPERPLDDTHTSLWIVPKPPAIEAVNPQAEAA